MNRFLLNYQSKIKRAAPLSSFSLFLFHPLFMFGNHCNLEQISTSNLNKCQFLIFEFFFWKNKTTGEFQSIASSYSKVPSLTTTIIDGTQLYVTDIMSTVYKVFFYDWEYFKYFISCHSYKNYIYRYISYMI